MTRLFFVALLSGIVCAGAARAQSYDQSDNQQGYGQPGAAQPAPAPRPMPSYHDGEGAPQPGGYEDSYGSADARTDDGYRSAPPPRARYDSDAPPPYGSYADQQAQYRDQLAQHRQDMRDYQYARAHYAARIAHWRARADACEAGNLDACRGPE